MSYFQRKLEAESCKLVGKTVPKYAEGYKLGFEQWFGIYNSLKVQICNLRHLENVVMKEIEISCNIHPLGVMKTFMMT